MSIVHHFDLSRVQALSHAPLKGPALIVQNPRSPVVFDGPTAASIAAAKAAQQAEREAAGVCPYCGSPQPAHMDSSGCLYIGCPKGKA